MNQQQKEMTVATLTLIGVVAVIVVLAFYAFNRGYNKYINESLNQDTPSIEELVQDRLDMKIALFETDVLNKLAECESGSVIEPDSTIILDTNNEMSIGRYQWQIKSVQYYASSYLNKELTRTQSIALAINATSSTELTRRVLFFAPDGWENWYTCAKPLQEQINFINKLR